jgi:hypothetical protein
VAPEAEIFMNKICSNNGGCVATEAIVDLAKNAHPDVINMSIGGLNATNDGLSIQETVINRLASLYKTLFVIAAGNSGPGRQTVSSPSTARLALSVGATATKNMIQKQYQWSGQGGSQESGDSSFMLFFSGRGPSASGGFKPNLVAPGTEMSSIQLNTAHGALSGVNVLWGTSMASPAAAGAYALLLDAINKYNQGHARKLTTAPLILKQILIDSARPIDPKQYNWTDQGSGMLDLPAAWKLVLLESQNRVESDIKNTTGESVEPDYKIYASQAKHINGLSYDGSRLAASGEPAFADGLYLMQKDTNTLAQVAIQRNLPTKYEGTAAAGELARQLSTTQETFELRTVYYGPKSQWMRVGVGDELPCETSEIRPLTLYGKTVEVDKNSEGKYKLNTLKASLLNICFDRLALSQFEPGDYGALIFAHRVSKSGVVSPVSSFVVPVSVTVPHKTLENSTAYEINRTIKGFGVQRNYVEIPKGTYALKLTLEVPQPKVNSRGYLEKGESCSGVEAMILEGGNSSKSFDSRQDARISNCTEEGGAVLDAKKRTLVLNRVHPHPGIWDMNIFGQYKYKKSDYKLRVDYWVVQMDRKKIEGGMESVSGRFKFNLLETSLDLKAEVSKSSYLFNKLKKVIPLKVEEEKNVMVHLGSETLFKYPKEIKSVTVKTYGMPGNDIDLSLFKCPEAAKDISECKVEQNSNGPGDEEKITFKPEPGFTYAKRIDGYDINGSGDFIFEEDLEMDSELGSLKFTQNGSNIDVDYSMDETILKSSKIFNHDLFKTGLFGASGQVQLKTSDETDMGKIEVDIKLPASK